MNVFCRLGRDWLVQCLTLGTALMFGFMAGCVSSPKKLVCGPMVNTINSASPKPDMAKSSRTNEWQNLFDGKTLKNWAITDFAGHGEVKVENQLLKLEMGLALTGVHWTNQNALPQLDYEVSLEAMKVEGNDFLCGLTFPVADSFCSLIVGGWGGTVVGLSSVDDADASENETTKFLFLERGRWFHIHLRVRSEQIEAWLDNEKVVDLKTKDRKISLRPGEIEESRPFGIATYQTTATLRNIRLRALDK